jgi:hypothetical protein
VRGGDAGLRSEASWAQGAGASIGGVGSCDRVMVPDLLMRR